MAAERTLDVEYFSQNDNWLNPSGSCNVTALATVLNNLGIGRNPRYSRFSQFEDELYQFALDKGLSRHSGEHLSHIARLYGADAEFTTSSSVDEIVTWLNVEQLPVIIHGYFTDFGHIISVVGFDQNGLIVHDPYGEWFRDGYRTDLSGAYLHYSYGLIKETCWPDGQLWAHYIKNDDY